MKNIKAVIGCQITTLSSTYHSLTNTKLMTFVVLGVAVIIGITTSVQFVATIWPRTIAFNYAGNSCINQPFVFPRLFKANHPTYDINSNESIRLFNYPVAATKLCIAVKDTPEENHTTGLNLALFGLLPIKNLSIHSGKYPLPNYESISNSKISTTEPLILDLDRKDTFFRYKIRSNDKAIICDSREIQLKCNVKELDLQRGAEVKITLDREYRKQKIQTIFDDKVATLDPLIITGGNASNGNIIYDKPAHLEVSFDKPLREVEGIKLTTKQNEELKDVEFSHSIEGDKLLISSKQELARNQKYTLSIAQAYSTQNNSLVESYVSEFTVSGGPKVVSKNTVAYAFDPNKNIVITFDQPISKDQDLTKLALISSGTPIAANYSVNNRSLTINPTSTLPSCANITITITNDVKNVYGINGNSGFKNSFRVLCRRSSVIGTSINGRAIMAHWFGNGPSMVLFVGGVHGNEKSGTYTMQSWLEELERHAERIPAGRTIVVVDNANPDGFAANIRLNSHSVDLNRNFPALDWKPNVTVPGYVNLVNGGGPAALSEPESAALANFVQAHRPRAVLTFHSSASLVSPNDAGDSAAIASLYASKTTYRYASSNQATETFKYDTTGAFEDWMRVIGIPNVLVEHASLARNEFNKNINALWAMVGL